MARRKPFDPNRVQVPPDERASTSEQPLSPAKLNDLIQGAIARHLPSTVHVLGEIGDISRPSSGHLYFTLKDDVSEVRAVMWRSAVRKLKFNPEVGLEVITSGAVEVYSPRGTYQLIVRKLEPRGVGALELAFRQLQDKLAREGLFDSTRKRPLPAFPQRVAVVTSASGAAIRDILLTLRRRAPYVEVLIYPVPVQGAAAAPAIAAALQRLNDGAERLGGIDVVIVGRGGGSLEDLWAFNEERVARAIFASSIPVISAVGHEVDLSIADLVADLRAATPTAAAELVAPSRAELRDSLETVTRRVRQALANRHALARAELRRMTASTMLQRPQRAVHEARQRTDELLMNVRHALDRQLHDRRRAISNHVIGLVRVGADARFARLGHRLDQRAVRLRRALERQTRFAERRIGLCLTRLANCSPQHELRPRRKTLFMSRKRLAGATRRLVQMRRQLFEARIEALRACDPHSVLKRGYSITREAKTRRVLRSVDDVKDGLRIITQLADGEFRATADDPRQRQLFEDD